MTEYERFRLEKIVNKHDDDNFSAHFSNISGNLSILERS